MRFIKQPVDIKNENFDIFDNNTLEISIQSPLWPKRGLRAGIVGASGSGKTNVAFSVIEDENGIRFKNVYIYSKTIHQGKIQKFLKRVWRKLPKKIALFL